jgi:hypothetical protein
MRNIAWVAVGWVGIVFWSAVCSRLRLSNIVPDAAVVTVVFLALRREPLLVALTALALGYFAGRQAAAPIGLHETALVATAVGVYLASGAFTGSGPLFFATVSAGAAMGYHLMLFLLLVVFRGTAGFPSWWTATLVPSGVATGALALASYAGLAALDRRLTTERREALSWR